MSSPTGKEYLTYRYQPSPSSTGESSGHVAAIPATIPSSLSPTEILIRITHSGVCYTDYEYYHHTAPLALGHEGVGIVEAIGSAVTSVAVGDRVGSGFGRDSCASCKYCTTGKDIWCYDRLVYGHGDYDQGTFSGYFVGREGFVHRIPEGLSSEDAAPLQCAGATVYSALRDNVKVGDRVGVLGIGGLGHLAIQFAAKMGSEVVVFSTSADKEAEARGFGASEFVLLGGLAGLKAPVDVLVVAGSRYPDWEKILVKEVISRAGTIIPLAAPTMGPYVLPAYNVFWDGYNLHSSLAASKLQHQDMLEFAARNKIKPAVELFEFKGPETIEAIFKKLEAGKVRYRAVLKM